MQLVLGVSVAESTARLALVDVSTPDGVLDEFAIDLATAAPDTLRSTIVGTGASLSAGGHRLAGTRISWSEEGQAAELRDALTQAGMSGVAVVSPSQAAMAYVRNSARGDGAETSALLFVDGDTAALSVVGADAATTSVIAAESVGAGGPKDACTALLERLREEPGGAEGLYVVGTSKNISELTDVLGATSPVPIRAVANPDFAVARGATMAAAVVDADSAAQPASGVNTSPGPQIGEHLAYSMDPDSGSISAGYQAYGEYGTGVPLQSSMAPLSHMDDPDEVEEPPVAAASARRPRVLLVGSTFAAMFVVALAGLAVVVAISIQPAASEQAMREYEAVPGKYLPVMPGQGTTRVDDAAVYRPPVVPVAPEAAKTAPVSASGGSGARSASPGRAGSSGGGTRTVLVQSGPAGGGAVITPPPAAFKLSDWLPSGLTINVSELFGKIDACKPGDPVCVWQRTGCLPGASSFAGCIEAKYPCRILCATTEIIPVNPDCVAGKGRDCKDDTTTLSDDPDCPAGATCVPLVPEDPSTTSGSESSSTDSQTTSGTDPTDRGETVSEEEGPSGPTTTTVVRPEDESPTPGEPEKPESSSPETLPSDAPKPSDAPTPSEAPKPAEESPAPREAPQPAPAPEPEPEPAPAPEPEPAPAPEPEPAPAPAPEPEPAPAPAPEPEPAPAPAPEPAPAPVQQAPVAIPTAPSRSSDSGPSSSSSDSSSGSGSTPETTVVETPSE